MVFKEFIFDYNFNIIIYYFYKYNYITFIIMYYNTIIM